MFSSSDTFVPPLHARRHVPRDAQRAPAAPGQLRVHTFYLPPALTPSRWHFTPITAHLPWSKPGGTEQGVRSPRELQRVCIQEPGCSFILHAGTGERRSSALPPGAPAWLFPTPPPLLTLISLLQGSISVFLLLFSFCFSLPPFPAHLCLASASLQRCRADASCIFPVYKAHSRPAAWNSPGQGVGSTRVKSGGVDCNCQSIDDCQFPLLSPVTGRSS